MYSLSIFNGSALLMSLYPIVVVLYINKIYGQIFMRHLSKVRNPYSYVLNQA